MSNEKLIARLRSGEKYTMKVWSMLNESAEALAQADKDIKTLQSMLNIETAANNKAWIDIEAKDKEIAELRKDALRYRWLANTDALIVRRLLSKCDVKDDIDRAIDAAIPEGE